MIILTCIADDRVLFNIMYTMTCIADDRVLFNVMYTMTCIADDRVLFNVMYTMVETLRWPNDNDSDEWKRLRENFRYELRELDKYCQFRLDTRCLTMGFTKLFLLYIFV